MSATAKRVIHYAGSFNAPTREVGPSPAVCSYGDRAEEIRRRGAYTHERAVVTCKACLRVIAQEWKP